MELLAVHVGVHFHPLFVVKLCEHLHENLLHALVSHSRTLFFLVNGCNPKWLVQLDGHLFMFELLECVQVVRNGVAMV